MVPVPDLELLVGYQSILRRSSCRFFGVYSSFEGTTSTVPIILFDIQQTEFLLANI
jgi:hypothetical protein